MNKPIALKNKNTMKNQAQYKEMVKMKHKNPNFTDPRQQFDRIGRFKPKILPLKIYFKLIVCKKTYVYFPEISEHLENYRILLKGRQAS